MPRYLLPALAAQEPKVLPPVEAKAAFLKLLDRPKVEADVKAEKPAERNGLHAATLAFVVETVCAVAGVALLVYIMYRNSSRLARLLGATGTSIVMRLSAFLLFCIGIQIFWNGAAELLVSLPRAG